MEMTEKWLGDIGGWQALKAAREFVRLGVVAEVTQNGEIYSGLVGTGARRFRVIMTVKDARNVDCKCGCPEARRGLICSHALAVGLTLMHGGPTSGPMPVRDNVPAKPAEVKVIAPVVNEEDIPFGTYTVYLATDQWDKLPKGTIPVLLQFQPGGEVKEHSLVRWIFSQELKVQTLPLRLPAEALGTLFEALAGHDRVYAGLPNAKVIHSESNPVNNQDKLLINNSLHINLQSVHINSTDSYVFKITKLDNRWLELGNRPWIYTSHSPSIASLPADLPKSAADFLKQLYQEGEVEKSARWVAAHLPVLSELFDGVLAENPLEQLRLIPADAKLVIHLDGNLKKLEIRPRVKTGTPVEYPLSSVDESQLAWSDQSIYPIQDQKDKKVFYRKNTLREQSAVHRIFSAGFKVGVKEEYVLFGESEILRFLASDLPRWRQQFEIEESDTWRFATFGIGTIKPRIHSRPEQKPAGQGADWLSLEVAYEAADGFFMPRQEVLRLIRSGKRDVRSPEGNRYLLDIEGCEELEETLQDVNTRFEHGGSRVSVPSRQIGAIEGYLAENEVRLLEPCPLLDDGKLKGLLGDLGNMLRPYQLEGVRWLERLTRMKAGGLLADEMGLGKTVQTVALLKIIKSRQTKKTKAPALVICPTSLLSNWSEEAKRFVPELNTHISHDADRKDHFANLADFDVIFTSYALIVRDIKHYSQINFAAIILDEASYIRNPDTESAKAVCSLKADVRFALTGTPVENSVKDLWSIYAFSLPRYLPIMDDFKTRFVKPLSQGNPQQSRLVMERLRRLIQPYLLRRTKKEVAKDLPEKIEKVVWCELSKAQNEVYHRILAEGREEIRQARKRTGLGSARMTMFTVLLRLRQTCNDLKLLGITTPKKDTEGGKWPVLEELLNEIIEGGGKALIFSQFVGMLRLVRDKVDSMNVAYSYIDGGTKDRGSQVTAFQSEPSRRLFLISLKAGGYGLNLTAADNVLLVDPWWNPAVEAQAIDRAHRIGQDRPVTAYRMITRGTVEEKILKLQSQKRAIMDMAMDDDSLLMSGISDTELEEMLM